MQNVHLGMVERMEAVPCLKSACEMNSSWARQQDEMEICESLPSNNNLTRNDIPISRPEASPWINTGWQKQQDADLYGGSRTRRSCQTWSLTFGKLYNTYHQ